MLKSSEPTLTLKSDRVAAEQLIDLLKDFNQALNIPKDFSYLEMKFTKEMVDRLAHDAMEDKGTIPNNPRKVFKEDVIQIYNKVLPLYQEGEAESCTLMENG